MSDDSVRISAGITGSLLAPGALLLAAVATVAFAFTPVPLAGPAVYFGYAFAIGAGAGLLGIAMSVWSLVDGRSAPSGAARRGAAIGLGISGIVLCSAAVVSLAALWLWLQGNSGYTPLWS